MRAAALRIKIQLETGQAQARVAAQFAKGQDKEGDRRRCLFIVRWATKVRRGENIKVTAARCTSNQLYLAASLRVGVHKGGKGELREAIDQGSVDRARRKEVPCINIAQRGD